MDAAAASLAKKGLQLFFVKDGWEGFMQRGAISWIMNWVDFSKSMTCDFANGDDVSFYNPMKDRMESFDANDALVIFKEAGAVLAFQVLTSNIRQKDHLPGTGTNTRAWLGAVPVNIYFNSHYLYKGLQIVDGDGYQADVHAYIGTAGCYQICPINQTGSNHVDVWTKFLNSRLPGKYDEKGWNDVTPQKLGLGTIKLVGY